MKFHKAPKVDPEYFSVISLFANSRIKPIFKLISPDYYFAGMEEYYIFLRNFLRNNLITGGHLSQKQFSQATFFFILFSKIEISNIAALLTHSFP